MEEGVLSPQGHTFWPRPYRCVASLTSLDLIIRDSICLYWLLVDTTTFVKMPIKQFRSDNST